jgi:hypothetical protein
VHFVVEFAELGLHWTAVEGQKKYRLASKPTSAEMAEWRDGAELSKIVVRD